ncbi:MAG: hypothetical protein WCP65_06365 [Bacteroidota bacterium]
MRIKQAEEIESQRRMKQIEVTNPEVLKAIKEYKGQSDMLTVCLNNIDDAIMAQGNIDNDSVGSVKIILQDAVDGIMSLNIRATTIALALGDTILKKQLNKSYTFFYRNNKEICLQKLDGAVNLLVEKASILTNIDQDDINEIYAKINLFRITKDAPRVAKVNKKTNGTDVLAVWVAKGKIVKDLLIKLLVSKYKKTNPSLAEKASLLGKPFVVGTRHNAGSYSVIDNLTGKAIINAIITEIRSTVKKKKIKTKVYTLNADGVKEFISHALGKALLHVEAADYINSSIKVLFRKNEPNKFEIRMSGVECV